MTRQLPMRAALAATLSAVVWLASAGEIEAQLASTVDVLGARGSRMTDAPDTRIAVVPGLFVRWPTARWSAELALESPSANLAYSGLRTQGSVLLRAPGPFLLEPSGRAWHVPGRGSREEQAELRSDVRAHLAGAREGLWWNVGGSVRSDVLGHMSSPIVGLGGWIRRFGLRVTTFVEHSLVRAPAAMAAPTDTIWHGLLNVRANATSAQTSVRWEVEHVALEATGGLVFGPFPSPQGWAKVTADVWLTPRIAAVASASTGAPIMSVTDATAHRHVAVGIRVAPWRSAGPSGPLFDRAELTALRVRPAGSGRYVVEVRAPGARVVELKGDVTGWCHVGLRPSGWGQWAAELEMEAGIHYVAVRVDAENGFRLQECPSCPTAITDSSGCS